MSSRIPGFYRLHPGDRLTALGDRVLSADLDVYRSEGLTLEDADLMVENVISTFRLPNAVGINFCINGRDRLVPMVVEEPSVVAAVSNMAKLMRPAGGFQAESDPSLMIGQVQLMDVANPEQTERVLHEHVDQLMDIARRVHPRLVSHGGGLRGMSVRRLTYDEPGHRVEHMVVLQFVLDCADAMGANMVNTVAERLAPHVEAFTGECVGLCILSNLADQRLARASVRIPFDLLDANEGEAQAHRIAAAWRFAWVDPYRATTHNKGVMNGIDAVAIATGNDWRAIEAGAHAYASRDGQYRPLTRWTVRDGALHGTIELPLQLGTVGGPIRVHPTVQANLRLLKCEGSTDLASVAAAVGLAQNLGALRALAGEGIQAGHMRMHARTIAATAGAKGEEIAAVTAMLVEAREFSVELATRALNKLHNT
ncbi:MAG: hydroxymethylglutaryl-CoA reductase [Kiritimatiellia bacterium]|jgi:hydroxymethylglutaryl-CoA reductase